MRRRHPDDAAARPGNPGADSGHAVLFYRDDGEFAGQVGDFLLGAVRGGGTAIAIVTPAHRRQIGQRMARAGVDMAAAEASGAYLVLDADETMRRFVTDDWPSPASFWQVVSPLVRQAAEAGRPLRVFGEMVALLWDAGHVGAAIELEAMWNELGAQYPMSLLCAYPADAVGEDGHQDALAEVCRVHSAVVGAPPAQGRA